YHAQFDVLPPSSTSDVDQGVWRSEPWRWHLHSWASLILPHLEQANLQHAIDYDRSALDPVNAAAAAQIVPVYRCPSYTGPDHSGDPQYVRLSPRYALRNYVAMGATDIGKLYQEPDGVFYPKARIGFSDILDGSSNTLFIVETREQGAAVWIDGGTAAVAARRFDPSNPPSYAGPEISLNYTPYYLSERDAMGRMLYESIDSLYGPSSLHAGGVFHLMGDGRVLFLSESMDAEVYESLASRAGGEVVSGDAY
ncbi:MAG: DUF1559 domain-containing protein, partial [Planctomycetaceae bacterium]